MYLIFTKNFYIYNTYFFISPIFCIYKNHMIKLGKFSTKNTKMDPSAKQMENITPIENR